MRYNVKEVEVHVNGELEQRQRAVQVNLGTIDLDQISREISGDTALGRGDVISTITHLFDIIGRYLPMGYTINLGELGKITPTLKSKAIPLGEEYKPSHIKGIGVHFIPSKALRSKLQQTSLQRMPKEVTNQSAEE